MKPDCRPVVNHARLLARGRVEAGAIGVLLAATIAFFYRRVLLNGEALYHGDQLLFWYPTHRYLAQMIRDGLVGLWNPYTDAGFPLIADGIAAPFYPPSYLFLLVSDGAVGVAAYAMAHLWVGAVGMYAFLRALRCPRMASLVGGATWVLGGVATAYVGSVGNLGAIAWSPATFLFAERLAAGGPIRYASFLAMALGLALLSTPVDVMYPLVLVLGLYCCCLLCGEQWARQGVKRAGLLITALVLGAGVSAVALLPQAEFAPLSNRSASSYEFAATLSVHPLAFVTVLLPYFYMQPEGMAWGHHQVGIRAYAGVVALGLALFALWGKPRLVPLFFGVTALLSALASLGEFFPLHRWLYDYLPFFSLSRLPMKILTVYAFSVAVLSALGTARLSGPGKPSVQGSHRSFLTLAALMLSAATATLLAASAFPNQSGELVRVYWQGKLSGDPLNEAALFFSRYPRELIEAELPGLVRLLLLAGPAALVIGFRARGSLPPTTASAALLALVLLDLFDFARGAVLTVPREIYEWYHEAPTARLLKEEREPGRFLNLDGMDVQRFTFYSSFDEAKYRAALNLIPQNAALVHRLQDVREGPTPYLKRYGEYMRTASADWEYRLDPASRLLALLNVRYILTQREIQGEQFQLAHESGGVRIYRNGGALPRAFVVERVEVTDNAEKSLARLADPSFDPGRVAVVESESGRLTPFESRAGGEAEVVRYEPDQVDVMVRAADRSLLVLGDVYYPGWEVLVDGVRTEMLKTDYLLRGVVFPAGEHRLQFRYDPLSFKLGVALTVAALGLCLGLLMVDTMPGRKAGSRRARP